MSVAELIADMTAVSGTSVVLSSADLDPQWASVKSGEATVSHDEVTQWLHGWRRRPSGRGVIDEAGMAGHGAC